MKKVRFSIFILVMTCACLMAGCSFDTKNKKGKNTADSTVVFTYAGEDITRSEVYIYTKTVKERYELQYGTSVWDESLGDESLMDVTKESIVDDIITVKALVANADSQGVSLSDEEKDELNTKAQTFYEGLNDADVNELGLTEDLALKVLTENALSGKVMDKLMENETLEISDEEARMTTFYDMYFACFTEDANGNIVPFSDEDKKTQYENAIQACSTLATSGIDGDENAQSIEKLAAYYNLDKAGEFTLSPVKIKSTYGEDVYDMLYSMENGDYSTVVETEYGYHIFQMIALTDQKATAANKESVKAERIQELLANTIDSWKKSLDKNFSYPDSVNMETYDAVMNESTAN